jgi:hypothetical protein
MLDVWIADGWSDGVLLWLTEYHTRTGTFSTYCTVWLAWLGACKTTKAGAG